MSNPYEPPLEASFSANTDQPLPPPQEPGLVSHVRIVAILMIVQGVLDILMGLFLGGMGTFMGTFMREAMQNDPNLQQQPGPSPEVMAGVMTGFYVGFGVLLLVVGVLQAYAGLRNYNFKSRTLGIVALISGVVTIFTCYCAPTSIALCIYGLIVYFNNSVASAFQLASQGHSSDAVLHTFSRFRYEQSRSS